MLQTNTEESAKAPYKVCGLLELIIEQKHEW